MRLQSAGLAALLVALLAACNQEAGADEQQGEAPAKGAHQMPSSPLDRLKQSISAIAGSNPGLFEQVDLENFFKDQGTTSASKFLNQRGQNSRRASSLAQAALKWRQALGLSHMEASQFPCDLFKLGLVFEHGRAHKANDQGVYEETSPVIWVRLGALGSIIKQLERLSPGRLMSYAYNAPRTAMSRVHKAMRSVRQRHAHSSRDERKAVKYERMVKNLSARENEALQQVLKSIAWWLEDWSRAHPNTKATLVLDFENSDFAFASWSVGEFLVRLDDLFPDLFERIIGFRYKAKLWSLHSPISMFNRIFKSRVSASPETDSKLNFVNSELQLSLLMPRIDSQGFSMLPEHVSGTCVAPDETKAPAGCQPSIAQAEGLHNPAFWQAVNNEFYHSCRAKVLPAR